MLKITFFSSEDRNLIIKHLHLSFTKFLYATVFSMLPLGAGNICFFTAVSHQTLAEVKEPPINTVLCKSSTCTPPTATASGCSYTFRDFGIAGSRPDVDSIWRWIFFPLGLKEKENTRQQVGGHAGVMNEEMCAGSGPQTAAFCSTFLYAEPRLWQRFTWNSSILGCLVGKTRAPWCHYTGFALTKRLFPCFSWAMFTSVRSQPELAPHLFKLISCVWQAWHAERSLSFSVQ